MTAITLYNEIQVALRRGERVVVATVVKTMGAAPCEIGTKLLVAADGTPQGRMAGPVTDKKVVDEGLKALSENHSHLAHIHIDADNGESVGSCGATLEIFFEVLRPEPRLVIVGAGYVAQALARLAHTLDFRIVVVDDRRDLADPQLFGEKVQLIFGDIPATIQALEPDESSWLVIVTRGHQLDRDALKAALSTRAAYVGMIGSTSKVKQIFHRLREEGIPRKQLERVHAPIGLDLGAETPDEIALSIAAEMVMLRRQGSGLSLKSKHNLLEDEVLA